MENANDRELIRRAFNRATKLDFFVARDLILYCSLNGIDEDGLCRLLMGTREALYRLGLCKRPDSSSSVFRDQVESVAHHAGVDPGRLAALLRETEAAKAMDEFSEIQAGVPAIGSLMAARDRAVVTKQQKNQRSKHHTKSRKRK